MGKLILALLGIRKELRRIREILEIAYSQELLRYETLKTYKPPKDDIRELEARFLPLKDEYGEVIEESDLDNEWTTEIEAEILKEKEKAKKVNASR